MRALFSSSGWIGKKAEDEDGVPEEEEVREEEEEETTETFLTFEAYEQVRRIPTIRRI